MQTSPTAKNEAPYRLYEFGTATAGPANTLYKLCWGWDPFSAGTTTQQNQAFSFEVGKFAMIVDTGLTCTLGVACSLQLEGLGLFSTNRIRIVEAQAGSCGSSTPTVTWPPISNALTGEKAKEISKSRFPVFPNFLGLVLGCIEAKFCK